MRRITPPLAFLVALCCKSDPAPPEATTATAALSTKKPAAAGELPKAPAAGKALSLLPDQALSGFQRVPLDPLAEKSVWQGGSAGGPLVIDGVGAKEMLLYEEPFGDGVLHVEWRFVPAEGEKPTYNGGIYVRTPLDGKSWVQLQVADAAQPPVAGDLIAQIPGHTERVDVFQSGPSPARPVGEWNAYDITMKGSSIQLTVNGQRTIEWKDCPFSSGHVGLQAEGARIEVRAFEFRPSS